jgi:hypothetical protein
MAQEANIYKTTILLILHLGLSLLIQALTIVKCFIRSFPVESRTIKIDRKRKEQ